MVPAFAFLGIPLFGVLLLVAERVCRNGRSPSTRRLARAAVVLLGVLLGLASALLILGWLAYLMSQRDSEVVRALSTFSLLPTIAVMLWAARSALRVGRTGEPGETTAALAHASRNADELRLSAWLLVLFPALLLGFLGILLVVPIAAFIIYGFANRTARRARESRFLWTLALAVDRDLPLDDEIEAHAQTLLNPNRRRYEEVANRMREGRSLIDALELSGVLSPSLVNELRAAQAAGRLPQALRSLAATTTSSLLENRSDRSIIVTTVYVWTLVLMVFAIVTYVMYLIVPKFKDIFNDFGVELPNWTMQAISVGDSVMQNFLLIAPLISLPLLAAVAAIAAGVVGWDRLNFPLLMRVFPRWDAPGLLRSLAYAVEAGRSLPEALEDLAHHQRRVDLRDRLARMQRITENGEPLTTVLSAEGFVYRPEALALESATRAGNLPWGMRTLADTMERRRQHRVQFWFEFVKPAAILLVGCIVGFFVIAFFLPLVKLIQELT